MQDQSASEWLKAALHTSLDRDPLDALNDALMLAGLLEERIKEVLGIERDS